MIVEAVLETLRERGITIDREGDKLYLNPEDKVTSEISAMVRAAKPYLLKVLTRICPKCAGALQVAQVSRFEHSFCEGCDYDRWEARTGTLSGAFGRPTGREMVAQAIKAYRCPGCGGDLIRVDEHSIYCADCPVIVVDGEVLED